MYVCVYALETMARLQLISIYAYQHQYVHTCTPKRLHFALQIDTNEHTHTQSYAEIIADSAMRSHKNKTPNSAWHWTVLH